MNIKYIYEICSSNSDKLMVFQDFVIKMLWLTAYEPQFDLYMRQTKACSGMAWRWKLKRTKVGFIHPAPSLFDPSRSASRPPLHWDSICDGWTEWTSIKYSVRVVSKQPDIREVCVVMYVARGSQTMFIFYALCIMAQIKRFISAHSQPREWAEILKIA